MEEKNSINITVLIAGRPYPLKIEAEDEVAIRQMIKEVNDKINRFQLTYTKKDKQDCMAMALLTYAIDLNKVVQAQQNSNSAVLSNKIQHINNLLDKVI